MKHPIESYGLTVRVEDGTPLGKTLGLVFFSKGELIVATRDMLLRKQGVPDTPPPEVMEYFKTLFGRLEAEAENDKLIRAAEGQ